MMDICTRIILTKCTVKKFNKMWFESRFYNSLNLDIILIFPLDENKSFNAESLDCVDAVFQTIHIKVLQRALQLNN